MRFIQIRKEHFEQVSEIYQEGIATGLATFEVNMPSWDDWNKCHVDFARIAIMEDQKMKAWIALSPVSSRCVYGGVAEVSIYVSSEARGQGLGYKLLIEAIKVSEQNGFWTLQAGIMRENVSSIRLHEKCGFRKIGYREKIAKLNGEWKDNVLMERRSKTVGI